MGYFKEGVLMTEATTGIFYISSSATGLSVDEVTSVAAATNGVVKIADTGAPSHYFYVTEADGTLGLTITEGASDFYAIFVKPSGLMLISDTLTSGA